MIFQILNFLKHQRWSLEFDNHFFSFEIHQLRSMRKRRKRGREEFKTEVDGVIVDEEFLDLEAIF